MPEVSGKIKNIYLERDQQSLRITLRNRRPQGIKAERFWLFKDGLTRDVDPHPKSKNFDAILSFVLWCASNDFTVQISTTFDLNKTDVSIDDIEANIPDRTP